ncbi:MAG: hypothetical protein EWV92_06060 [Microcystis aeruginosa Ma_MB_S_20031200_S102]|uniref:Uncharacterized protein n=1 Tax=Microcystis aeruginosa Ma_MB_S_20031200_S102 TaxID=2486254 RepID=A0A552EZH2_MICAE|nr:MAG: hypothetical protein EWV92_06060 [Microcystis aeruginosa Ma_MB_S_20031200_S102]
MSTTKVSGVGIPLLLSTVLKWLLKAIVPFLRRIYKTNSSLNCITIASMFIRGKSRITNFVTDKRIYLDYFCKRSI